MEDFLYIGRVAKPHGVRGEIKVFPTTDDVRRFDLLDYVYVQTKNDNLKFEVLNVKYVGKFVVLKLSNIDTLEQTLPLKNGIVKIEKSKGIPLEQDEYYYSDLIGMEVFTKDGKFGKIKDIIKTGSNDVYEVATLQGDLVYLPAIKQCILDIDVPNNKMQVHIMDGLI